MNTAPAPKLGQHLPEIELEFNPHSTNDPAGRVFKWNRSLYRGITPEYAELFARLFNDGVIDRLAKRGLIVESELTDYQLDSYPLVIKHREIPVVSHPLEWSPSMLRDAALVTLDLNIELIREGLTLRDAHPWNILFDGPSARHIDLTSIKPLENSNSWEVEKEFLGYFLYPLVLMSSGRESLAECLMYADEGVRVSDLMRLIPTRTLFSLGLAAARRQLNRFRSKRSRLIDRLKLLRSVVQAIPLRELSTNAPPLSSAVQDAFRQLICEKQPKSLLLVDCSDQAAGLISNHAAQKTVAIDTRSSTDRLYRFAHEHHLTVLPLHLDLLKATAAFGNFGVPSGDAATRLRCEMVLAPNLTDRLKSCVADGNCEYLVRSLAFFSSRWTVFSFNAEASEPQRLTSLRTAIQRTFRSFNEMVLSSGVCMFICEMPL